MSRHVHEVAAQLRADPMFAYLGEDEQHEAARVQLAVAGVLTVDPLDVGICVQVALKPAREPIPLRASPPPTEPATARAVTQAVHVDQAGGIMAAICDAVPYLHRTIAERLGCSRALVTAYANGTAPERLKPAQLKILHEMLMETRTGIDRVLDDIDAQLSKV